MQIKIWETEDEITVYSLSDDGKEIVLKKFKDLDKAIYYRDWVERFFERGIWD